MRRLLLGLVLLLACMSAAAVSASAATRPVLWVGNNWDGTADAVDPFTFKKLAHLNIVPDKEERLAEIMLHPPHQAYFLAIRPVVGGGAAPFVAGKFTPPGGGFPYVCPPHPAA